MEHEPAGQKIEELLVNAHEHKVPLLTIAVNAGEVWHITARKTTVEDADEAFSDLHSLGIDFVDADWALSRLLKQRAKFLTPIALQPHSRKQETRLS
jgi:hypothetical protein